MPIVQFDATVEGNMIRIPEEYLETVYPGTRVTMRSNDNPRRSVSRRAEAGALLPDDFSAFRVDTKGFKFDREEADER
jgi:hypothetical protein